MRSIMMASRKWFALMVLSVLIIPAGYQTNRAEASITDAASSVYNRVTGAEFTISKIAPDIKNGLIQIYFTAPCTIQEIRSSLKFIPPVPVDFYNSSFVRDTNILTLRGQFQPGQRYAIILPPTFKSTNGKTYKRGVAGFMMPDRDSDIAFLDQGTVIERNSRQMLHVQIINVEEVRVKATRIPMVLLPLALPKTHQDGELVQAAARLRNSLGKDGDFADILGEVIGEEQLFFTQQNERNVFNQFSIPLTFRKEKERGAVDIIQVMNKRAVPNVQPRSGIYRITDIGLTYKLSEGEMLVWATSLFSGKPLANVALYAFTSRNEVVPLGKTDGRGLHILQDAMLKKAASLNRENEGAVAVRPLSLSEIKMVAAVSADDQTYVDIVRQGNIKPEGVEQAAQAHPGATAKKRKKAKKKNASNQTENSADAVGFLRGHVFTERGIYRPGETVYFKGTVREYRDKQVVPPKDTTVKFKIVNSKNEEIYSKDIALSEFGTASDQAGLKAYFPLGTYTVSMQYGADQSETASRSFEVQEFRQPRHFVEINYTRETKKDDAYVNLDVKKELLICRITGKYYAGGPVKHGKVRWSIYHTKSDYPRQDYPGYSFGHPLDARTDLIESGESMLDEKGQIIVPVPVGKDILSGKYGIEMAASVVDFDGRASTESSVYQADPDYLVGISNHPPAAKPGDNQTLYAMVIDKKGNRVGKGSVTVQVMERGWTYIQKRNAEGYLYNEQQQIWRSSLTAELPIKGERAVFDFDFTRGGEYLIAFTYKDANNREYVSATKYTTPGYYDYEYENRQRDLAKNYGRLNLYAEKPLYSAGETVKVFMNPPREVSTCLVTVEQGGLVEYFTTELKPDQKFIELPVKDSYSPNVYISVLATVPRSSFPVYTAQFDKEAPTFVFGTVNVEVKGGQQKIKIAMNEEQKKIKSLPGAEMTLNIATTDPEGKPVMSEMALAVVDESILSMTGFETPTLDALGKFILPLGVFTGDLRLNILRQTPYGLFRNAPLTGGDGEEGAAPEAVSSKVRKDFNPVAYFNPSVRTDANGRATVKFTFPDTMTTYRVYAVACDKGSRFGTFQRPALVVKDFYMEPGMPAFFTRGDKFKFFVSAFNKTGSSGTVNFSAKSDQPLALVPVGSAFSLPGLDRTLIPVEGTAQKAGTAALQFSGRFKDYSDVVELKVPVNSGHVLGSDTVFGNFRKATDVSYNTPKAVRDLRWEDVGPDEVKAILTVSGSPFMRMSEGLRYFLHYPYGCVEQTSSGVLPLAALRGIIQKGLIPDITIEETDKFIKPGIERLFSMQTSDGGFGYWPGDRTTHAWGTIYALTALTRAQLAGYDLPKDRMNRALAYLRGRIKESGKDEQGYRAFAAYILALNKTLDKESFNAVFSSIDSQPREAAMLVLMAGKMSGLLPVDQAATRLRTILERPWTWNSEHTWNEFYARYREPAISLLASMQIFPNDELTHRLAAKLIAGIGPEGIWTSTSDTGWSLIALTEYFSNGKSEAGPAIITVRQSGRVVETFTLDPASYHTLALDPKEFLKNPKITITSNADQATLYKLALTFPRTDYAKTGYSNGFEVHKTIKNTDNTNVIKVGDIVEVKLKLNIKNRAPNYVVLDDPLPAGFVAINSAIKTEEAGMAMKKMKHLMQRTDSGDDEEGESEGEYGEGFDWSDYYWDPYGYYRYTPNFMEIRNDRVVAFRNNAWSGVYEYSYYARAVCEGEFIMPSTKIQLMYDPDVVGYTPEGKVVVKGNK